MLVMSCTSELGQPRVPTFPNLQKKHDMTVPSGGTGFNKLNVPKKPALIQS